MVAMLANLSDALPLNQAIRAFFPKGRTGNPVHLSTALRWIHRGVIARNGERVYLQATRIGGTTYVDPASCERFIEALNAGSPAAQADLDAETARRAKQAGEALERLGA